MKIIFMTVSLLIAASALATVQNITDQYLNRNWNYPAIEAMLKTRSLDYSNMGYISSTISLIDKLESDFSTFDPEDLSYYFPSANLSDLSSLEAVIESLKRLKSSYTLYLDWEIFFKAISEDRWYDLDENDCKSSVLIPLENPSCGRKSKVNYAFANFSSAQRLSINDLKNAAFEELNFYKSAKSDIRLGQGPARMFQFLFDARILDLMIQPEFVSRVDPVDPSSRKRVILEIGRALIIQAFQDKNGSITNSDLNEILLEKSSCFNEPLNQQVDCQLNYLKALIWNPTLQSGSQVITNLILDPKGIKPVFDAIVLNFSRQNSEEISREQMEEFLERAYFTLALAYDMDPEHPVYNSKFIPLLDSQIKRSVEYLINKRNIIGLKIARGLQELIMFLESES